MSPSAEKLNFDGAWWVVATAAAIALVVRLLRTDPIALVFLDALVLVAIFGRPLLLRRGGSTP